MSIWNPSHPLNQGMTKPTANRPLAGKALLQKVKELDNLSREEKARACGYSSTTKKGQQRINLRKFYQALVEAKGVVLDSKSKPTSSGRGRSVSYRTKVQANGTLLIGSAYTKQLGLQPGDPFELSLKRKHIYLKQVDAPA
jgi:hypothetical protein